MSFFFGLSGDLYAAVLYAYEDTYALLLMAIYTFLAYIAINFHMALVQEFGGTYGVYSIVYNLCMVFIYLVCSSTVTE